MHLCSSHPCGFTAHQHRSRAGLPCLFNGKSATGNFHPSTPLRQQTAVPRVKAAAQAASVITPLTSEETPQPVDHVQSLQNWLASQSGEQQAIVIWGLLVNNIPQDASHGRAHQYISSGSDLQCPDSILVGLQVFRVSVARQSGQRLWKWVSVMELVNEVLWPHR